MTTILQIAVGASLIGIVWIIGLAICKAGAMDDFQRALWKCKNCKYYENKDEKHRLIACKGIWKIPEECLECNKKDVAENPAIIKR